MSRISRLFLATAVVLCLALISTGSVTQVSTGTWTAGVPTLAAHTRGASVLLPDGHVMLFGGDTSTGAASNGVEIFDPTSGSWSAADSAMLDARAGESATLLKDGRVLLAGGENSSGVLSSLEIYDPQANTYVIAGALSSPRKDHAAALLRDGRVLIIGGSDGQQSLSTSEIFDPVTQSVSAGASMDTPRTALAATTLLDGTVLIAGGNDGQQDLASALLYDPATGSFSSAGTMQSARSGHTALRLDDNNTVLIFGGKNAEGELASAELYIPWKGTFSPTGAMAASRNGASAANLVSGVAIAEGGSGSQTTELYGFATVMTDQQDYAPGEPVEIFGSGWKPGETVKLTLHETSGSEPDVVLSTVADASGNIYDDEFYPDLLDYGVRFYVTASGQSSAREAQNTFTDGLKVVVSRDNPTNKAITVASGASFTVQFKVANSSNGQDAGTPLNISYSTSIGSATKTGGDALSGTVNGVLTSFTRSFTLTAPAGPATFSVVLSASCGSGCTSDSISYDITVNAPAPTDSTPPVITPNVSGTLGSNGWYTSNVTVSWSVSDPESTITSQTGCGSSTVNADTTGTTFTCSATSAGGSSSQSVTIKRDATAPVTTYVSRTQANDSGWNKTDVTVNWSCSDATSGAVSATTSQTVSSEGSNQSATGTCSDNAGNSSSDTQNGINIDKTAPSVSGSSSPAANSNGWNNSDVTVSFTCTDTLSGLAAGSPPADTVLSSDGASQSVNGSCTDKAGNTGSASVSGINIDKTPPTINASRTPAANADGWNKTDVVGSYTASDSLSGLSGAATGSFTFSSEGAGQSHTFTVTDLAGNSASATVSDVNIDKTAPAITFVDRTAANTHGWNNTDVTVNWSCSDALSGAVAASVSQTVSSEGSNQSSTGTCTDKAGNSASDTQTGIKIDKTAPTGVSGEADRDPDHNGWYNHAVGVSFTGTDSLSGIDSCTSTSYSGLDNASASVSGSCTDNAGNTGNGSFGLKYDASAPSATLSVTGGTAGSNGWYTSDVTVHASGSDSVSGIESCTGDQFQTTETTGSTFNGSCTNGAGLSTNASALTVKLDKTGPSASLAVSAGTLGNNGWYTNNVTVSTSGADSISSPVSCTADQFLTTDSAGTVFNGSCTNQAGLTTAAASLNVKRDATPPTLSPSLSAASPFILNQSVTATANASDATSGLASSGCDAVVTSSVGSKALSCSATDNAGNTASSSLNYAVGYDVCLLYDPSKSVKSNATIPIKLYLCDVNRADYSSSSVVVTATSLSKLSATSSPLLEDAGNANPDFNFRFDPTLGPSGGYIFNLQTKGLTSGTYQLNFSVGGDGIASHSSLFGVK